MSDDSHGEGGKNDEGAAGGEPLLLSLILMPFRLVICIGDLAGALWLLLLGGGFLALIGFFLWALLFGAR